MENKFPSNFYALHVPMIHNKMFLNMFIFL